MDRTKPNLADAVRLTVAATLFVLSGLVVTPIIAVWLFVNELRRL